MSNRDEHAITRNPFFRTLLKSPEEIRRLGRDTRLSVVQDRFSDCSTMAALALMDDSDETVRAQAREAAEQEVLSPTLPARTLALQCALHGVTVVDVLEPNADTDGVVQLTPKVHLQVPFWPDHAFLVSIDGDGIFTFQELNEHFPASLRAILEVTNQIR